MDLHRLAGHRAGHVRDVRRGGQDALGHATSPGRFVLSGGLGGMGGAQPLAATMAGARVPRRRGRSDARAAPARDALPRRARARSRHGAAPRRRVPRQEAGALDRASSATRPTSTPSSCGAASRPTSSPIRRARTIRSSATSRRASRSRRPPSCARAIPRTYVAPLARVDGRPGRGDARDADAPARTSSTTATTCARRPSSAARARDAFAYPGLRARRTSGRCSARARGRSAGPRSRAIRRTSASPTRPCSTRSRTIRCSHRWMQLAQRADRVPGPARAHLLARLRRARTASACASTSSCAPARSRRRS